MTNLSATLRELAAKATPGEWRCMADGNQYIETAYLPRSLCVASARIDGIVRPWNPHAYVSFGFRPAEFETARFLEADAALIVALVNHAELLASALELAEAHDAYIHTPNGDDARVLELLGRFRAARDGGR